MPALPSGFIQNPPKIVAARFIGSRQFVFLLAFVAVFTLVTFFFLNPPQNLKKHSNAPSVNFEEVNFPTLRAKDRVTKALEAASLEKDRSKKFDLYSQVFIELLAIYNNDYDSKTRKQTEDMANFIANQFPKQYQANNFTIPCLDSDCGQPNYSQEVLGLKEKIEGAKAIDPFIVESISKKFGSAGLSNDPNAQWEYYLAIFNSLVSEKRRTNDESVAKVAQDFRDFLNKNFPQNYSQIEGSIPGVFDL